MPSMNDGEMRGSRLLGFVEWRYLLKMLNTWQISILTRVESNMFKTLDCITRAADAIIKEPNCDSGVDNSFAGGRGRRQGHVR